MMKKLLFFASTVLFSVTLNAQNLNIGDIIVIGCASDTGTASTSVNEFSWVPLVNLQEGTKIYFTDAGYNSIDSDFMGAGLTDEILLRYITPVGGVAAGTVFTVTESGLPPNYTFIPGTKFGNDFNGLVTLPNAGDQITIFQSDDDENMPLTFGDTSFNPIFMVTGSSLSFTALASSTAAVMPVFNLDNVTNLAPGLTNGINAVAVGSGPLEVDESDNARYIGITAGTRDEILSAVCQLSNWARHDVAFGNDLVFGTTPNGWTTNGASAFTVTGLGVAPINEPLADIGLYPNPAKNKVRIKNESGQKILSVTIYNSNGTVLQKYNDATIGLDVSSLPVGVNFVVITLEKGSITRKLIRY